MISSNLKMLAKFGLCSNCSQNLDECSLARELAKCLQVLAGLDFRLNSLPCNVSIIYILKTKTDTGNNISRMGNWETLGKLARAMNVSGKLFPRFDDFYLGSAGLCRHNFEHNTMSGASGIMLA